MTFSIHRSRKAARVRARILLTIVLLTLVFPLSPAQAAAVGEHARVAIGSRVKAFLATPTPGSYKKNDSKHWTEDHAERALEVADLDLCPRQIKLYAGESSTLVPIPLDRNKEVVHGISLQWESSSADVADVTSSGEVIALAPGHAKITVQAGTASAHVNVNVKEGVRPPQTDEESDRENAGGCGNNQQGRLEDEERKNQTSIISSDGHARSQVLVNSGDILSGSSTSQSLKSLARPAMVKAGDPAVKTLIANASLPAARAKAMASPAPQVAPQIDGGNNPDLVSPGVSNAQNAVGNSRFAATAETMGAGTKTKKILGSYNYQFTAPVLSQGGRGVGVSLALSYNSRLWSIDGNKATFNYSKGWPAAGWSLGYGRIIENYDGLGNYLLIEPDGTRRPLEGFNDPIDGVWRYRTTDGTFIKYSPSNKNLRYPDGTLIKYEKGDATNNRLLPTSIIDTNGNKITIGYHSRGDIGSRWAIRAVTDTLNRVTRFYYYLSPGDTQYDARFTADPSQGKPYGALAAITAPNITGRTPTDRVLIELSYKAITLQYDFGTSLSVNTTENPASGSQIYVMRRIYYPDTGRGFIFSDYSSYGIARTIAEHIGMTQTGDGSRIAYTRYNYATKTAPDFSDNANDPSLNATQVGSLNDAPQYSDQYEWWDQIPGNQPARYEHSRSAKTADPRTETIKYPNGLQVTSSYNNDSTSEQAGNLVSTTFVDTNVTPVKTLREMTYLYHISPSIVGGPQVKELKTKDDVGNESRVVYSYVDYGRLKEVSEYSFSNSLERKAVYDYTDERLDKYMMHLVSEEKVYQGATLKAKTQYVYDEYDSNPLKDYTGMPLPNMREPYTASYKERGNVTNVMRWSDVLASSPSSNRTYQYDIFGNIVKADVSCCNSKLYTFSQVDWYAQPNLISDGSTGESLLTRFSYDFSTGLVRKVSDTNQDINLKATSVEYDSAWRVSSVQYSTGAKNFTTYEKDGSGKDKQVYIEQVNYKEIDGTEKWVTIKSRLDGIGNIIRMGTESGASPAIMDMIAFGYNNMGRPEWQTNPYRGDLNTAPPALKTTNRYDALSRVDRITLPDNQTITTNFNGAKMTVTDQVGRKRRSEFDALGRTVKVVEQNPATGLLDNLQPQDDYVTTYTYNAHDQVTTSNQSGQVRTFEYDGLSRLRKQVTPEGGTVEYTYTDFGEPKTRTQKRVNGDIVKHYDYDGLNRLTGIKYTGSNESALPPDVAATPAVSISYEPRFGNVYVINDGVGSETHEYDDFGRLKKKIRTLDSNPYETTYEYNELGQLAIIGYPSKLHVRMNYDTRGRLGGVDKLKQDKSYDRRYVSALVYTEAGQLKELTFENGVKETFGYNNRLQLTSQIVKKGTDPAIMSLTYGYQAQAGQQGVGTQAGNTGQLMSITGNINSQLRSQTFTYDTLGRLTGATGWNTWYRRYEYDRWGNRTKVWQDNVPLYGGGTGSCPAQLVTMEKNAQGVPTTNRMAEVTTYSSCDSLFVMQPQYDNSGNIKLDERGRGYQHDAENRIATFNPGQADEAKYWYDASNRRVKKLSRDVTTYYIWEGSQCIAEYSTAVSAASGTRYYHQDRLSTRIVTNPQGGVVGTIDQMPFGEEVGEEAGLGVTGENQRFTTYERDAESRTDYAINRQYQASVSRFLQPDVVLGNIQDPQSLNRYSYTNNDPVNLVDPLGLDEQEGDEEPDIEYKACPAWSNGYDPITDECLVIETIPAFNPFILRDDWASRVLPTPRSTPTDNDTRALNALLGACNTAADYGQYTNILNGQWKGKNGKWYRMGWGGNGSTGGRSVAVGNAQAFKILGRSMAVLSVGVSAAQGYEALQNNDKARAAKAGLDITMTGVGVFGGPVGATVSGTYLVIDLIGWDKLKGCDKMLPRPFLPIKVK